MNSVLVLNSDYTPLNITTWSRGFILVHQGKAEIIKEDNTPIISGYRNFVRPIIIRLFNYIKHSVRSLKVNRNRIYKRDNHKCVYCGSRKDLTIDHVIPKSKGGTNEWTNLVTCCFKCNFIKADRTPEQANMKMSHKPYKPQLFLDNDVIKNAWEEYNKSFFSIK